MDNIVTSVNRGPRASWVHTFTDYQSALRSQAPAVVVFSLLATYLVTSGVSFNVWFFVLAAIGLMASLANSLRAGALFAMVYYCIKPAFGRLAYYLDATFGTHASSDVLRYSGGLFLVLICLLVIAKVIHEKRDFVLSKLDMSLLLFMGLSFLSIFNPHNSLFNGLAGFERNVFPTVFLFFVGREVIKTRHDLTVMMRVFAVVALVTVLFGLKHAFGGVFGFETIFLENHFAQVGFDGWLTVGLNGVEFRNFSTFFGYMEFTFTLALWMILLLSISDGRVGENRSRLSVRWMQWKTFKWLFGSLSVLLLALTMERTPIMMALVGGLGAWFMISKKYHRRTIILYSGLVFVAIVTVTALFQQQLEETGIAKLQRLAEMADPSQASSIDDRIDRMWKPTLAVIAANPMGVGVGYGSKTIARGSSDGFDLHPHNEFLQKAIETGILGAALFTFALWGIFIRLKRQSELSRDRFIKSATAAGCGIVIAFVACGMVNLPFSGAQGCFFWFVSGALISVGGSPEATIGSSSNTFSNKAPEICK
ncbi:O-antigen ligase family protein [bacterium AH-315-F03]|nr:O-antigen ligase family protein [bacterium AH-315-F03]